MTDSIEVAQAEIARLTAERDAAIKALCEAATARGQAEGKLAASEMAGVVEGWKTRAEKAEAERDQALAQAAAAQERIEALTTRPKAHEVTPRPAWDDETCLRFAEAYDREDAAQRGEADPHAEKGDGYAEWAAERISCVRAGLGAVVLGAIKDHAEELRRKRDG